METMLGVYGEQQLVHISHASDIAVARRAGQRISAALEFDETAAGRLAIVITEASTNILKHAGDGFILLTMIGSPASGRIEVVALDRGPGIANLHQSLLDGVSTVGTAGTGLGAMRRLADDFDVYSTPGKGSVFFMKFLTAGAQPTVEPVELGAVCMPIRGEESCGDAWSYVLDDEKISLLVADGLGHGVDAATAAQAAVGVLHENAHLQPRPLIEAAHPVLYGTRGAAVAVAELRFDETDLQYAGVGNIAASVIDFDTRRQLMSHNGIVGHTMRKVQQIAEPWPDEALLVMHSDGLGSQWNLDHYPGLYNRHPALVAAVLYRDHARGRDDVTVLVARRNLLRI